MSQFQENNKTEIFPVVSRMPADLLTPLGAYLKLSKNSEYSYLFESVEGGETLARYSFIGANPEFIARENNGKTEILQNNQIEISELSIVEYLKNELNQKNIRETSDLPSFVGGAVGFLDFSTVEYFEPAVKNSSKNAAANSQSSFMFFRTTIAFDHAKQQIIIVTLVFENEANGDENILNKLKKDAEKENEKIIEVLENEEIPKLENKNVSNKSEIESNWEKEDFKKAVEKIKDLIDAGECYQVVLSQCFTRKTNANPISIYRALRSLNPSPYMFLLQFKKKSIIGASPEMLVRCRNKKLEYRPIAGTRPRGKDEAEDAELALEMLADKKEISEHTMLVDLGRNDLGRVAKFGSVKVENLMSVEKFSHVQHIVSYLFADLKDDLNQFDALASCFPAGTVSGAPKVRAVQIIQELEPTNRGIYSGAVGYFDYAGNLDTCIAIRTLVLENGWAKIQAGAGIVADSVPETEYEETLHKAKGLFKAIELAESGKYGI